VTKLTAWLAKPNAGLLLVSMSYAEGPLLVSDSKALSVKIRIGVAEQLADRAQTDELSLGDGMPCIVYANSQVAVLVINRRLKTRGVDERPHRKP
jgi:hypothetical protein